MLILLDCDGVLADFFDYLLKLAGSEYTCADLTDWDIFKWLGETELKTAKMLLSGPEFWATQPVLEGAQQSVEAFRSEGHHVICVTSPWLPCKYWGYARREWLKTNFDIPPEDVIVAYSKYHLRGDVFIDDKPASVRQWNHANPGKYALLYDQPYNEAERLDHDRDFDRASWKPTRRGIRSPRAWLTAE